MALRRAILPEIVSCSINYVHEPNRTNRQDFYWLIYRSFTPGVQVLGAVTRAFSAVLAHMDRNVGLLLLKDVSMRDMWVALFQVTSCVVAV